MERHRHAGGKAIFQQRALRPACRGDGQNTNANSRAAATVGDLRSDRQSPEITPPQNALFRRAHGGHDTCAAPLIVRPAVGHPDCRPIQIKRRDIYRRSFGGRVGVDGVSSHIGQCRCRRTSFPFLTSTRFMKTSSVRIPSDFASPSAIYECRWAIGQSMTPPSIGDGSAVGFGLLATA